MDEILIRKSAAIERCIARINDEYIGHEEMLVTDYTKQDSILLNLQRAIQTTLDMSLRFIKLSSLDLPSQSKENCILFRIKEILDVGSQAQSQYVGCGSGDRGKVLL